MVHFVSARHTTDNTGYTLRGLRPLRSFGSSEHVGTFTHMGFGPGWPFTPRRIPISLSVILARSKKMLSIYRKNKEPFF